MAQIALEKVSKQYGNDTALSQVTLTFPDNVLTAVVGTSGSGKSTLLQCINGLVRPTEGVVHIFERPIDYNDLPRLRLQIGYAVQGTGLFPHLTVEGNITLLGRLQRWDREKIQMRAWELMKLVGLPQELYRRYPHELSGGQQQRVGLCRAMMLNPRLFLLDEPFGALDPVTRAEIHDKVLRLQQVEARTIVMVTHDLREALKLAQWILVMHEGLVVQQGSGQEVVEQPANDFVRHYFRTQLEN